MTQMEQTLRALDAHGVSYQLYTHPPVFTIEEMEAQDFEGKSNIAKNLFLRNANGKQHFLIVMKKDKHANLKALRQQLGTTQLSFASPERLEKHLHLEKGAVTPLGVLFNSDHDVTVAFDQDFLGKDTIGVHPCDNRATVFLTFSDLRVFVEKMGNPVRLIALEG